MSLFDVTLNSIPLSSLSDKIIVRDILEQPIEQDSYKTNRAMNAGQRVSAIVRRAMSVRVVYVIRERDPRKRADIQSQIAAWARDGGVLMVNYRTYTDLSQGTSLQLHVVLDIPPVQDSALKWTQDLSMTFTAYNSPYWESTVRYTWNVYTSYESALGSYIGGQTAYCTGTAPHMPVSVTVTNVSSYALQSINIQCGSSRGQFQFTGLSIAPGETLVIDYDEESGMLQISGAGISVLANRTADSADDLYMTPGSNALEIAANVQVTAQFSYRGLFV